LKSDTPTRVCIRWMLPRQSLPSGQTRHFDRATITSGLPLLADNFRAGRHVSKVPATDSCTAAKPQNYSITSNLINRCSVARHIDELRCSLCAKNQGRAKVAMRLGLLVGRPLSRPYPVTNLSIRSVTAPTTRPAATSLAQCASRTTRVATNPAPMLQITLRCFTGSVLAAEASAPMCTAWPDGNASSRLPEKGTPRQCP